MADRHPKEAAGKHRPASALHRVLRWAWREFLDLLPAILYFFAAFTILTINEDLILGSIDLDPSRLVRPLIGALLVAKILLVVDLLPVVNALNDRPLIWGTAWKAALYWVVAILFQLAETTTGGLVDGQGLDGALGQAASEALSYRFILIQMWLSVLLGIFVALQSLIAAVGPEKVRTMFFGSSAARA